MSILAGHAKAFPPRLLSCLVEQFSGPIGYDGDVMSIDGGMFLDQLATFQRQQMFCLRVAGDVVDYAKAGCE